MRGYFTPIPQPPAQMEWRIAHNEVKPDIRLIGTDITLYQIGLWVQETGDLVCVLIQLTAIDI